MTEDAASLRDDEGKTVTHIAAEQGIIPHLILIPHHTLHLYPSPFLIPSSPSASLFCLSRPVCFSYIFIYPGVSQIFTEKIQIPPRNCGMSSLLELIIIAQSFSLFCLFLFHPMTSMKILFALISFPLHSNLGHPHPLKTAT